MNITNEQPEETAMLTRGDLAVASYALAEVFNSFLAAYSEEDYGDGTKEQMESSMNRLRTTFVKFDSLLQTIADQEEACDGSEVEEEVDDDSEG